MNTSIWNRDFVLVLMINAVQSLGFQILVPNLPSYALRFTTAESMLGILGASIAFAALFSRPFTAVLADRGKRKRTIIIAQFAMVAINAVLIVAPNIFVLIAMRIAQGIVFAVISTMVVSAGVRMLPKERMGYGVGLISMTNIGCQAIAPALGIFIAETWSYQVLFAFVAILSAAAGIAAFSLHDAPIPEAESGPQTKIPQQKFSLRRMFAVEAIDLAIVTLVFTASMSIITNFLVLYAKGKEISGAGYYFTIFAVTLILIRLLCGGLIDRMRLKQVAWACAFLVLVGLVLIAFARSFLFFAIAAVLIGIGYGMSNPALQAAIIDKVSPDRIGAATATFYMGMDAAHMSGPILFGVLAENISYSFGYLTFGGILVLIVAVVSLRGKMI